MWKERLSASRFPFVPNSDKEMAYILFKDSPERLVLMKWIYNLMHGLEEDISPKELAEYFLEMGVVDGDPLKFVEGNYPKKKQEKIWKNLFQFCTMMKCTPEICKSFVDKYRHEMSTSYEIVCDPLTMTGHQEEPLSVEAMLPDWDNIIADIKEQLATPSDVSITEEDKEVLGRLKEYIDKFSLIESQLKVPEPEEVKKQKEFGNSIANLCTTLQTLEADLISSNPLVSSMRHLEMNLDEYKSKSKAILKLVGELMKGVERVIEKE